MKETLLGVFIAFAVIGLFIVADMYITLFKKLSKYRKKENNESIANKHR